MSVGLIALALVLYFLPIQWQILPVILLLFIIGVGMGLHAGGIDNLALSSVDASKAGLGAGVLNSLRLGSEGYWSGNVWCIHVCFYHSKYSFSRNKHGKYSHHCQCKSCHAGR
ncbi:Uncharacterised protein [Helicobacter mustelae]|nr:Uncharacterised protein [Helicobacter mustelae]